MSDQLKTCSKCEQSLPLKDFTTRTRSGKTTAHSWCKPCKRQISRDARREGKWSAVTDEQLELWRLKGIESRKDPTKAGRFILEDTRKSDRKRGLENDLTREIIDGLIKDGCRYCGGTELRMTLDRKDNEIGHTQANVVPACYRCNIVRGTMPYEAWLLLVPAMRAAYEQGLFGDWRSQPISRK